MIFSYDKIQNSDAVLAVKSLHRVTIISVIFLKILVKTNHKGYNMEHSVFVTVSSVFSEPDSLRQRFLMP